MDHIKTIRIPNPPTKFTKYNTRKSKNMVYYLTGNLFLSSNQWITHDIIQACKRYLKPHLVDVPKLDKMRLELIYCRTTFQFDLDNKGYFWEKVFFDILKTPTPKQYRNAYLNGNDIISVEVLKDDTVKHVDMITKRFERGPHELIFVIHGVPSKPDLKLNL